MKKILVILIFTLLLGTPSFAEIGLQTSDINVEIFPLNPGPYTDTTISLTSYATDLNKSMITWKSGSKTILSGYGKTKYSFTTLGANEATSFIVTVEPFNSLETITKPILINPSDIQILWEAVDGYTPPFYRGKSFVSSEGKIKVVAIPNTTGTKTDTSKITYNWRRDNNLQQNASGFDKNSYTFNNESLNNIEEIDVNVSSISGEYTGGGNIEIPITKPKILFYQKTNDGILYNEALNNFYLKEDRATIVAEPYYLDFNNNLDYSWKVNGKRVPTPPKKTELTIEPADRGGYATISLTIENFKKLFQKVTQIIEIKL
ncbi:MAG: hypothetical protein U9R00_03620 [Patescibacteria group bacterium]|nr:hypothetical protein [Patescibacteria group bacterium]